MDLLDRLLGHDSWTTRELLRRCEGLTDAQLDREFDIGPKTVRRTLAHVIGNVGAWSDLMEGRAVRSMGDDLSIEALTVRLEEAAAELARVSTSVRDRAGWDDVWTDHLDDPPRQKTFGGAIAHVITHSMHHRAQLIYMLRELGVTDLPEGDVLSWENRSRDA